MSERKAQLSITVDQELVDWVDLEIKRKRFANRSHAIERALYELMSREGKN